MGETLLEVKELRTSFFTERGVAPAVDGISFTVQKGRVLGIVGESGSGKSVTSLSVMRLLQEPAGKIMGGQILFKGQDLTKLTDKQMQKIRGSQISMVFQEPMTALNPVYTVGDQIAEVYMVQQKLKKKEAWAKATEMMGLVGIPSPEERMKVYPHQMSGGMRQRVVIALALSLVMLISAASTALNTHGGNMASIAVAYAVNNKDAGYTVEDIQKIKALAVDMQAAVDQIENGMRQVYAGYITTKASNMTAATYQAALEEINNPNTTLVQLDGIYPNAITTEYDISEFITKLENTKKLVKDATEKCDTFISQNRTYTWTEISGIITPLVNIDKMTLGGKSITELKKELKNSDGSINFDAAVKLVQGGLNITVPSGSGLLSEIADFVGDYTATVTVKEVTVGGNSLKDVDVGMETKTTYNPPIAPAITVIFSILEAYTFDFSRSPFPITFPRRIVPALAIAKQKTEPILRTTVTSELAATASVPRCPRITEYMENATLQETSFPRAGSDSRTKSPNSTLLRINI